ncbi:Alpha/Beta hydrolase protein [Polychytrium aggregatum]|uniref:Alpha/Beta hydrolase protein n=1 Tax=Polychytrium aggregatum TaxID=110093 RepID=UPI0022FE4DC6|nr:Alpha/Beta hydrolase protein [Polychytrium aggregatum]KAI9193606.1 Alpha/Beta hydrolase protein [Polychytrium aggregatum]
MTCDSWDNQSRFFDSHPDYQCCVFDNRGVGRSSTPSCRYTTSDMAKDVYELLIWLGWKSDIHLVGISMGGMISLELAHFSPEMFTSLTLVSTTAGLTIPPVTAMIEIPRLLVIKDRGERLQRVLRLIFPQSVLEAPPPAHSSPEYKNMFEYMFETSRRKAEAYPPQNPIGALAQLSAVMTHHVSSTRLKQIGDAMKGRIQIVTGTWDQLVRPSNSTYLSKQLSCTMHVYEGGGHALPSERPAWFNDLLVSHFGQCARLVQSMDSAL